MSTSQHTPTPWNYDADKHHIVSNSKFLVARMEGKLFGPANAAFIVRACNSHEALVEALEAMEKACDEWAAEFTQKKRAMNWGIVNDAYCKATTALSLAKS